MEWIPKPPEYIAIFLFGSIIGSFLNVVICRIPDGQSLLKPPSHCPHCQRSIKPWENIPILSFLLLRGRCAGCRVAISWQYPLVEFLTGALLALLLFYFNWSWELLIYCVLFSLLLALSVIDLQTYRLPNALTLAGAIFAILLTVLLRREFLLEMFIGGAVGVGLLGFMGLLGRLLFRKSSLGIGDIKLAGMIGLFLGPWSTAGMFIIGVFIGAVVGVTLILAGNKKLGQRIPFGPYLAGGALVALLWGKELWGLYWGLLKL